MNSFNKSVVVFCWVLLCNGHSHWMERHLEARMLGGGRSGSADAGGGGGASAREKPILVDLYSWYGGSLEDVEHAPQRCMFSAAPLAPTLGTTAVD